MYINSKLNLYYFYSIFNNWQRHTDFDLIRDFSSQVQLNFQKKKQKAQFNLLNTVKPDVIFHEKM
jgi:hypothetical protein